MDHDLTTINLAMSKARIGELIASFGVVVATAIFMLATERTWPSSGMKGLPWDVTRIRRSFRARDPGRFAVEWRPSNAREELVIEYGSALLPAMSSIHAQS